MQRCQAPRRENSILGHGQWSFFCHFWWQIGMLTLDKTNHKNVAPCYGIEGTSGPTLNHRHVDALLPKPSESYYPGRFEIHLSLSDRWGTCFVPHDGGFSREMNYQNKLNPGNGLFLEICGDNAQEKEGVKYIEITIFEENWLMGMSSRQH